MADVPGTWLDERVQPKPEPEGENVLDPCPYCAHNAGSHVELKPSGALATYPEVVACTDFMVDPATGEESFCDCIWDRTDA